jgi:hypothetical protein
MTRKFLDEIEGQINSTLPDNTTGLITPANHRTMLLDLLESTTPLIGELFSPTPVIGVQVGNTFQAITDYEQANGGDPTDLVLNAVAGTITSGPTDGWNYSILGQVQVEAGNGIGLEVGIAGAGVVQTFVAGITGRGAGNPVTGIVYADVFAGAPTTAIDLRIRNINGGTVSVDIVQSALRATLLPTQSAPPP